MSSTALAHRTKAEMVRHQATSAGISIGAGIGMYFISFWALLLFLAFQGIKVFRSITA